MPPRKISGSKAQDHSTNRNQGSGSKKNTARDSNPQSAAAEENQIDYQALIQEMLNESQQRINEALQNRQNNLLTTIMQYDSMVNSPRKTSRK